MNLALLIDDLIASGVVDPHEIAEKLEPDLDDDVRRQLVFDGLVDRVRAHVRAMRSDAQPGGSSKWATASREPRAASSKWASARKELAKADRPVYVNGKWKALGDCTVADVEWMADHYARQAETPSARGRRA